MVLGVDETTALPPRPRRHATRPARPGRPTRVEHEDQRAGALDLLAALAPRTGRVDGQGDERQRPGECIAFLAHVDAEMPAKVKLGHRVCAKARPHHGQHVREWRASPPRLVVHCTPVHGAWLNPGEPWCSMLQRKRWRSVDVASTADLQAKLMPFMAEWKAMAHPFNWTTKSVAKVMADAGPVAA